MQYNICPWNSYVWASIYDVLLICFRLLMSKLLQCKYNGEWAFYLLYPSFFFTKVAVKHHKPPWGRVDCLKNPLNCVPKACRSWLFIVVILPSRLFYWVICHLNAVIVGIISKGHGGETMFCLNNDSSWRTGCSLFNQDGQRILTETSGLRYNINCEYNMI